MGQITRKRSGHSSFWKAVTRALPLIRPGPCQPATGGRVARARCEPLEKRLLLTIAFNGTNGNDVIEFDYVTSDLSENVTIVMNGVTSHFNGVEGKNFDIEGLGGNDSIYVYQTYFEDTITVRGGAGDDRVQVGHGNFG